MLTLQISNSCLGTDTDITILKELLPGYNIHHQPRLGRKAEEVIHLNKYQDRTQPQNYVFSTFEFFECV